MDKDKKIEIQKRIISNLEDENLLLTQKNKELKEKIDENNKVIEKANNCINEYENSVESIRKLREEYIKAINEIQLSKKKYEKEINNILKALQKNV